MVSITFTLLRSRPLIGLKKYEFIDSKKKLESILNYPKK